MRFTGRNGILAAASLAMAGQLWAGGFYLVGEP